MAEIEQVPPSALQDKADRPFYLEALPIAADAAVFSPFDLNMEQGKIEEPRKPVLRISTQIRGPDGKIRAILVLNYLGSDFLHSAIESYEGDRLLNADGYWLVGPSPAAEWAFMYPDREKESLKDSDPALWNHIKAEPKAEASRGSGSFIRNGTLYTFRRIDSLSKTSLNLVPIHGERLRLTMLNETPLAAVAHDIRHLRWAVWIAALAAFGLFVPLTWIGVAAIRENALSRIRLKQVIESSPNGFTAMEAVRDASGRIVDFRIVLVNTAADSITGRRTDDDIGRTILEVNPRAQADMDAFRQVVETGQPATFESYYVQGNVEGWHSLAVGKWGENGIVMNITDITERRKMEDKLRQSQHLLQMAGRISRIGAWSVEHPSGRVTWNTEMRALFEVADDDTPASVEKGIETFSRPEYRDRLIEAFQKCARDGTSFDVEAEIETAKGSRRWLRRLGEAEFDTEGRLRRIVGTAQDITEDIESRKHEQELARKAVAADRAKSDFLAIMSHEIRTPMTGILGCADQLAGRVPGGEEEECVQIIQECGRSLLRILDDILDYSRMESGCVKIEKNVFSPRELIGTVHALFQSTRSREGVSIRTEIALDVPRHLFGDAGRVRQILVNLMGNASKFTERGSIVLGIRRLPSGSRLSGTPGVLTGPLWLAFSVRDTGIGIPAEKLTHVFDPFAQADLSISRRYGGTGLGLAISRQLAHLMGGDLDAESEPGKGTTFTCVLPFEEARKSALAALDGLPENKTQVLDATFATHHPLNLLVAEDDPINVKVVGMMLRKFGYEFTLVQNGRAAVDLFRQKHPRPDCILMDLHMPELDGIEASRQIRRIEREENVPRPVFISAFSAAVLPEERERCVNAGINDYLAKPVRQEALAEVLRSAHFATAPQA